ncbi:hypothetical protein JYT21_00460 [bacterium AH-315-B15]|nr:hypothetical protein [bacterium AH-315-B15]
MALIFMSENKVLEIERIFNSGLINSLELFIFASRLQRRKLLLTCLPAGGAQPDERCL